MACGCTPLRFFRLLRAHELSDEVLEHEGCGLVQSLTLPFECFEELTVEVDGDGPAVSPGLSLDPILNLLGCLFGPAGIFHRNIITKGSKIVHIRINILVILVSL